MKKLMILILACCFAIGGCGTNEKNEKGDGTAEKERENPERNESIEEFLHPDYEKFNSKASENGLGGTLIYIEGKVSDQTVVEEHGQKMLSVVVEQKDKNRWLVGVPDESEMEEISNKNVRIFGEYQGYSGVFNLPAMVLATKDIEMMDKFRIEVEDGGEYRTIWTFSGRLIDEIFSTRTDGEENKKGEIGGEIEILSEYTLPDGIGWYTRHFIIVKNNSSDTVDVSTSSLAYSPEGEMVGAANGSIDALGAGCASVLYEAFEIDGEIERYETELSPSKSKYHESVIQDLSYEQNDIGRGAVFQVTNNGNDAAKFVEGYALFFKDGVLVSYESAYFTDDDSELKPGNTISKQLDCRVEFDEIEFYLTGRK